MNKKVRHTSGDKPKDVIDLIREIKNLTDKLTSCFKLKLKDKKTKLVLEQQLIV